MLSSYSIRKVDLKTIREFVETNHYSQSVNGLSANHCFAAYDPENKFVGAAIFGQMAMANAYKKYAPHKDEITELRRFVCIDDTPKNFESYFLSKCLLHLRQHTPIKKVVSYADPNYGHEGVIYKASNFEYLGDTAKGRVIMYDGKKYHDKAIRAKYNGVLKPFAVRLRDALKNGEAQYVEQKPKRIYLYNLRNRKTDKNKI